jgi:predicted kinase
VACFRTKSVNRRRIVAPLRRLPFCHSQMNKIFALCGKPGAGKSTLADKIAKRYKSVIFSADKIMLKLFGEINGRDIFENSLQLCKEMIYEISDNILKNTRANIIFDFGFWTKIERKKLKERFKNYDVVFIYIEIDDDARWKRIEKRNSKDGVNSYKFDKGIFDFLSNLFEEFSEDEEYIIFDTTHNLIEEIKRR